MDIETYKEMPATTSRQDDESSKDTTVVSTEDVGVTSKSSMTAITTALTSGLALFSDGYNAQIIGYMNPVFAKLYPDSFSSSIKTRFSNAFLIGEVLGMLFFGYAIDKLGRRTGIVFATLFLVLGIILATAGHGKTEIGMFWMMIVGRGIAGFGAGSSTEASDETTHVRHRRGFLVADATDFSIDLSFVMAGVIALIVLAAFRQHVNNGVWRVNFGIGFILPVALLFFRFRQFDSTQYQKHAIKKEIPYLLVIKRYWKPMLGTSLAWFFYDFVSVFPLLIVLYGIFNALGEMGPGVATFLCAAESFPTPLRGHFLGFAAAVGKAGATIGTQAFTPIQDSFSDKQQGIQAVFLIGAAFAAVGGLVAWFLIPDKDKDLESKDAQFCLYLQQNGYKGSFGNGLDD
ncbi:hypothetical protein IL306_000093 [Fusarium sp. DS 682]|nr:hypothetical protein IL306_000093 [Fusarium sp. DS 682]